MCMRVVWVCQKGLVPVFLWTTALFFVPSLSIVWHCWFTEKLCLSFGNQKGVFFVFDGCDKLPNDPWTYSQFRFNRGRWRTLNFSVNYAHKHAQILCMSTQPQPSVCASPMETLCLQTHVSMKYALLLDFQVKVACQMWKLSSRNPNKRKMDFGKMTLMVLQRPSWHKQVLIPENTWHFHYPAYRLTGFKGAGVKLWLLFDLMWSSCHASGVLFDSVTLMTVFFYLKWSLTPKVVENTKHTADSTFWHRQHLCTY